jgi:hypothetical protein
MSTTFGRAAEKAGAEEAGSPKPRAPSPRKESNLKAGISIVVIGSAVARSEVYPRHDGAGSKSDGCCLAPQTLAIA